ncbi:Fur family transcriptional regulator [Gleimia hominis]|uniref:Fur family transcriptional regulator n=1 Tax=Gleimia hominis TaxID=595468 RepID=UPI000C7FFA9C|nr:transcriptional repressor [Gleimia hominis]WIK64905.1 transcriptional repressor [Gleimia hominis]
MSTTPVRRHTRQRQAVMDELRSSSEFRSAQQIHEDLAQSGSRIGLATVYRNLRALADEDDVDVLMTPDGEALYRQCDTKGHHHHLICRRCHRSVEIEVDPLESWFQELGQKEGFTDLQHSLEIFGLCSSCQKEIADR